VKTFGYFYTNLEGCLPPLKAFKSIFPSAIRLDF